MVNVCGDRESRAAHLLKIRQVFDTAFLTMRARPDANDIVLAFKDRCPDLQPNQLNLVASQLKRRLGLDFPRLVRRIALDVQLRRWERAIG